jgi:outer membrane receptor protein involved in Fe transport
MNRRQVRWSGVVALGLMVMLGSSMVWAQAVNTGTVTGTVFLPDGTPSPGATVVLKGPAIVRGEWPTISDNGGRFVFLRVPPGTYTVTTSLTGFNTEHVDGVVINAGTTVPLTVNLEIAPATGEIVVTSEAPIVDTRSSTISTTFDDKLLDVMPTARQSFYDLTLTAAGMAAVGADESWLPSPSAYGSASNENIFLVDGVNTTNPRGASWGSLVQVNYDTVQEVKVLSLGSRAEYGSFSGAAVDVLTKTGSNQFHGSGSYYTLLGDAADNYTTSFGNSWMYVDPADDITTAPIDNTEYSFTLGGPIIKDMLWFYAGFDRRDSSTDTPLWIPLETYKADLYDIKLTGAFGTSQRAWLGYHYEDNVSGNTSWGATWDPTMRYDSPQTNDTWSAQYQWVISDRNLFGAKYLGYSTKVVPSTPGEVGHPGFINWWKWTGTQSIGVNGDFPYVEGSNSGRGTFQADFTHYADNWAGDHELKFGVQYTTANGDWLGGYFQNYANFAYPYPWGYDYNYMNNAWWHCDYTWCLAPTDGVYVPFYNRETTRNPWLTKRESDSLGVFVDDQWVVSDRVTIDIGLRYDNMSAKYGTGYVYEPFATPDDVNNPTVLRERQGTGNIYDFKTWSPRLGFAWTLTGDGKTVLRGHVGRYYFPLGVESLRRFGPDMGETITNTYIYLVPWDEFDTNGNGAVDFNETPPATSLLYGLPRTLTGTEVSDPSWDLQVAPGTTSPYTDQFNLSIQRQLSRDIAVEFTYIYKVTKDLLVLRPYDPATGEFYEWESVPYTSSTGYQTQQWSIVLEDYNEDGVINWSGDGAYVTATGDGRFYRTINAKTFDGQDVKRTYQGLQMVLNKRYSDRWQGTFAINYTDTNGFYPRVVDQNWYIDGPLVMDTPFGSSFNHFQNNLDGPALMTPKWMAKLAGSYTIPVIDTDFGFRVRYDSGRAIFPVDTLVTYASWMGDTPPPGTILTTGWGNDMVAIDPTTNDWLPSTTIVDLSLNKRFDIGRGMGIGVAIDALNAFNEGAANRVGFRPGDYGRVYGLVTPRVFRLGLKFDF